MIVPRALLLAVLAACALEAMAGAVPVIPPGSEAEIGRVLGAGETLPGGCRLEHAAIDGTRVEARYACAGQTGSLELRHPADAPAAPAAVTAQFAISVHGTVPPALVDAVVSRLAGAPGWSPWRDDAAPAEEGETPTPATSGGWGNAQWPLVLAVLAAPLAIIFGLIATYGRALCAPPAPGERFWGEERLRRLSYLGVFAAVLALSAAKVVPDWGMQLDEERDFILSTVCAEGHGCPLVGNEMNQLRLKLGPLNRYLLTLCVLVTPDPRFALSMLLVLHALAAAWLAAIGDRLFGWPFGVLAGALYGANFVVLEVIAAASNGAWSPLFLVCAVAGALRWIDGEPRAVVLVCASLAAASQLHGTNLILVAPLAIAVLWWRPPITAGALIASVAVVVAMYSTWLIYQWETGWEDFAHVSATWMVAEGPALGARLNRIAATIGAVPALGGVTMVPLALLTLAGAAVLASGRAVAAADRPAGRTLVLLLLVPLAGTVLAGASWVNRYAVPVLAPGALAAAAAVRQLTLGAARRDARLVRAAVAVAAILVVAGTAIAGGGLRSLDAVVEREQTQLGLAEQREAVRILGEHGFAAGDLEWRVHGLPWTRWNGGQVYLGRWLIGTASRIEPDEHAAIVGCRDVAPGFAAWRAPLTASRHVPRVVAGYHAELSPVTAEVIGPDGVIWQSRRAVPFYGQMLHGGDGEMRRTLDPLLAYPRDLAELQRRWMESPPRRLRLTATLAPGGGDRIIALSYDGGLRAAVRIGGEPGPRLALPVTHGGTVHERFLVPAAARSEPLAIEALIDLPGTTMPPARIDLYEEPPCSP